MPYRIIEDGRYEFSGPMLNWYHTLSVWFGEDIKDTPGVEPNSLFGKYILLIVIFLALKAEEKWKKEFLGGRKVQKINSFVSNDSMGIPQVDSLNALDFLAGNLDHNFLIHWASECRKEAKQMLDLK